MDMDQNCPKAPRLNQIRISIFPSLDSSKQQEETTKNNLSLSLIHHKSLHNSSPRFNMKTPNPILSKSVYKQSWEKFVYKLREKCSVGMRRKPLLAYDQNHDRNKLKIIFKKDKNRSKKKNTFANFSLITNESTIRRTFQSTYHKSFKHPDILKRQKMNGNSMHL